MVSTKELENRIDLNNRYNRIEPYFNKHFVKWNYAYNQTATPANYEEIINNSEFAELIFQTIQAKNVIIFNYQETILSVSRLIELIGQELQKRA